MKLRKRNKLLTASTHTAFNIAPLKSSVHLASSSKFTFPLRKEGQEHSILAGLLRTLNARRQYPRSKIRSAQRRSISCILHVSISFKWQFEWPYRPFQSIDLLMKIAQRTKRNLRINHMTAVLKSVCFLVSRKAMLLAVITISFSCYQINTEARTTHK